MTLDEAIKRAERMAEKNEKKAKNYPRPDRSVKGSGKKYNDCIECASEHRQIAEWLKELRQLREQNQDLYKVRQEINNLFSKPACYIPNYDAYKMFLEIIDRYLQKINPTGEESEEV